MKKNWLKPALVAFCSLIAFFIASANFVPQNILQHYPSWAQPISLGLDLKGGAYILMDVDMDTVLKDRVEQLRISVREAMLAPKEKIRFSGLRVINNKVMFSVKDENQLSDLRKKIRTLDEDINIDTDGNNLTVYYSEKGIKKLKVDAMNRSIEIVRRRIDALGTKEPIITAQGERRISIQLPGVSNPEEVKSLIGKTAKMTFHKVVENGDGLGVDTMVVPYLGNEEQTVRVYKEVVVSGEYLTDSRVAYQQDGQPAVTTTFNGIGAKRFADLTAANIGKRFAIVLDGKVLSAPVIQSPILDGHGQITGGFTAEGAAELSMLLRSGALPAPLTVVEERTVGAGLGADSITAGAVSCVIGLLLVMISMFVVYGLFGNFVNLILFLNIALILSVLSLFGATLTLPGIAGILLTIAMAVDANIIIFERMREEAVNRLSVKQTISMAYSNALSTIMDANITTIIAAVVLFQFGTGPIKGFAVTLGVGVITSLITSVYVSRIIMDVWAKNKRSLPIVRNEK